MISSLDSLKHFEITQFLLDNEIVSCATSNNHSVILTTNELLVCGTNFGQMGEYASRSYRLNTPKSFIRVFLFIMF